MVRREGVGVGIAGGECRKLGALVAIPLLLACGVPVKKATARPKPPVPTIVATVLTIHTEIKPENKSFTSLIVAANDQVRIGDELDQWRLFDLKSGTVTFVDDIRKTFRTVPGDALLAERQQLLATPHPEGIGRATIQNTGVVQKIGQWPSRQYLIHLGAYHRELWLSTEPILGEKFFALMTASEPIGKGLPGVMRDVEMELVRSSGVPVTDHAEMPFGNETMVIDRHLQSVEQRAVPLSWITIPASYRNLSAPIRGSAADHPPASSTLPDRAAPAKE